MSTLLIALLLAAGSQAPLPAPPPLSAYGVQAPPAPMPLPPAAADAPRAAGPSTPAGAPTSERRLTARGGEGSDLGPTAEAKAALEEPANERPVFGALLDAGLPGGIGASAVVRPFRALRIHAGGLTNTASSGARAGVSFLPFGSAVAPSLTGEVGWLSPGDVVGVVQSITGTKTLPAGLFNRAGYFFESAQLGLELGAPDRFVVWIRAGFSWVQASLSGSPQALSGGTGGTIDPGELKVNLMIPSGGLGLLFYFG